MAIFKKDTIVKSYPAFNIVTREAHNHYETEGVQAINISSNEVMTDSKMLHGWRFNSSASYALENNNCPIAAYQKSLDRGEKTHWISSCAVTISATSQDLSDRILIQDGDVVRFEGRLFTIAKAPNSNKVLVPYKK
jgi:hypothetical protein